MPDKPNNPFQFWQELKRRKVFRVIAMYLAAAYVIIELSNNVVEPLSLPEWTPTMIIVLLVIGFPFAVIFSWIFDITPEGVKKTESAKVVKQKETPSKPQKRKLKVSDVIIVVLLIVVCILAYPKIFKKDKLEDIRDLDGRISIAVMPFQNMTNDTIWDVWQEGIQNELITNLSNSRELSVLQYQTMYDIIWSREQINYASITPSIASDISHKLKANTFILGSIKESGGIIRINAQLVDSETEEIYTTFQIDGNSEDDIFNMTDSLSSLLKDYLEIKVLKQDIPYDYTSWAFTSSAEAYRYYIQGLNSFLSRDYKSAIEILNKAILLDTSFFAAYNWLIGAYNSISTGVFHYEQDEQVKQLVIKLMDWDEDKLSRIEQLSLKMTISTYIDKNPQEYIKNCKLILEYDPQQRLFWFLLGQAYGSIYEYEKAINAYEKALEISKQWGVRDKWFRTYVSLGAIYHYIGNHNKEKDVYELGLRNLPDIPDIIIRQAICALSLEDTTAANEYIAKFSSIGKDESFWSDIEINHRLGHMYFEANLLDEAEEIFRKIRQLEPQNPYHMRCFANYLIGYDINVEEGIELANKVLEVHPGNYDLLSYKGWGLYKQGHLEQALEILNEAWDKRLSYSHEHYLHIQEVEQALANQNK